MDDFHEMNQALNALNKLSNIGQSNVKRCSAHLSKCNKFKFKNKDYFLDLFSLISTLSGKKKNSKDKYQDI